MTTAYLAAEGFVDQLRGGAAARRCRRDASARAAVRLRRRRRSPRPGPPTSGTTASSCRWPRSAAPPQALRDIQRNWAMYAPLHHRRAALIQDRLPHVSARPIVFPAAAPTAPLGSWTLLAPDRLLAAARCSSPFANGEVRLRRGQEPARPTAPISSCGKRWCGSAAGPRPGERCLDLGASPGGWTWVLARLGAAVLAVDKAPLDPEGGGDARRRMARRKRLRARAARRSGRSTGCSPTSSAIRRGCCAWSRRWRASGLARNFVCTLKFQGATDHDAAAASPPSPARKSLHLHHNKHELTFLLGPRASGTALMSARDARGP